MNPDIFRDDDAMLAALRAALATAQHPQHALIVANAQDAFSFSTLDEELATLVYDSLLQSEEVSLTREPDQARTVVFESAALSMELEIGEGTIVGQVAPAGEYQVRVEAADGAAVQTATDELGCFTAAVPAAGPLRFRIARRGSATVTEWTDVRPGS